MDNVTRRLLTLVSAESDQTHALGLPGEGGLARQAFDFESSAHFTRGKQ